MGIAYHCAARHRVTYRPVSLTARPSASRRTSARAAKMPAPGRGFRRARRSRWRPMARMSALPERAAGCLSAAERLEAMEPSAWLRAIAIAVLDQPSGADRLAGLDAVGPAHGGDGCARLALGPGARVRGGKPARLEHQVRDAHAAAHDAGWGAARGLCLRRYLSAQVTAQGGITTVQVQARVGRSRHRLRARLLSQVQPHNFSTSYRNLPVRYDGLD